MQELKNNTNNKEQYNHYLSVGYMDGELLTLKKDLMLEREFLINEAELSDYTNLGLYVLKIRDTTYKLTMVSNALAENGYAIQTYPHFPDVFDI